MTRPRRGELEPLFPGYGFTRWQRGEEWQRLLNTPGVYAVLGSHGSPTPLWPGIVEDLQARTSIRNVVDDPGELEEVARLSKGDLGSVLDGPYASFQGICTLSSKNRCSLLLSLFGRMVPVSLPWSQVAAA